MAPEIYESQGSRHDYTLQVDCWALGVLLYEMISDTPPFSEDRTVDMALRDQILTANFEFYPDLFDHISVDAKDMIEKLLVADPKKRLTTEQILQHSWLQVIPFLYHSKRADT